MEGVEKRPSYFGREVHYFEIVHLFGFVTFDDVRLSRGSSSVHVSCITPIRYHKNKHR